MTSPQTRVAQIHSAQRGRRGPAARAPRLTEAELERAERVRRRQLRCAVTAMLAGGAFLVGLPLLLDLVPALDGVRLLDVPVSWLAVAVLPWPVLAGLAWWQLLRAEAAEDERTGDERTGDERTGDERTGDERTEDGPGDDRTGVDETGVDHR